MSNQLTWFDRSGKTLGTLGAPDPGLVSVRLAPDGHRVAVGRNQQNNVDVWIFDGSRTSRVTFNAGIDMWPVWSSDGTRLFYTGAGAVVPNTSSRDSAHNPRIEAIGVLYQKASNGSGAEELLLPSGETRVANDASRDGRFLLFHTLSSTTSRDLWVLPLEGDRTPRPFLKTPADERYGAFSPDSRWVAYESDETGRMEVYIRSFTESASGQWQVSTTGGIHPRWRADGRELYFLSPAGDMMAAPIAATGPTLAPGDPVKLFPTKIVSGGAESSLGVQYDVSPDGRFLINVAGDAGSFAPITLLQNWQGGLSAREKQ